MLLFMSCDSDIGLGMLTLEILTLELRELVSSDEPGFGKAKELLSELQTTKRLSTGDFFQKR